MSNMSYKFEKYRDRSFPVYMSIQKNRQKLVNPHFHDDMELLSVLSGSVCVLVGTKEYLCHKGDIIFIAPTVMHEVNSCDDNAAVQGLVFRFSAFKKLIFDSNAPSPVELYRIYRADEPFAKALNHEILQAEKIYNKSEITYKIEMTACILNIVSALLKSNALSFENNLPHSSQIRHAIEYIEKHYNEKIKISTLSKMTGVCDDRFIRIFKSHTGRTPMVYIIQFRLHEAMKLLSSGQFTVAEVAEKTGFSDIHYFSRVFKKHLGVTPSNYSKG